jgi:glucose-1-phosphate thymidylyltransferase
VKGVVLAGGLGTRFHPITKAVNKHLLDVFDEPMVHFPIRTLAQAGITDIVLVSGEEIEQFQTLLGDGSPLGVTMAYAQQHGEGGIADVVILGDNIFQEDLGAYVHAFAEQGRGSKLLLKRVSMDDARRFGVASIAGDRITEIVEKPSEPASDLVVTGCYMYDARVFDIVAGLKPSDRGELEITDVNNAYVDSGETSFDILKGWWTDAGTPPSKLKASILVALAKGVTFHA